MYASRKARSGFTLVEILIVVVILGILAAIVIPQFTSASESAKASSLVSQLQTIRSQIELYQVQHNGDYPDLVTDWTQLTEETNIDGETPEDGDTTYGPYLQKAPVNSFQDSSTVVATFNADAAWLYTQSNGDIKAIMTVDKAREVNLLDAEETGNDDIATQAPPAD
jgi:general secretion pathway protein G